MMIKKKKLKVGLVENLVSFWPFDRKVKFGVLS